MKATMHELTGKGRESFVRHSAGWLTIAADALLTRVRMVGPSTVRRRAAPHLTFPKKGAAKSEPRHRAPCAFGSSHSGVRAWLRSGTSARRRLINLVHVRYPHSIAKCEW